MIIGFTNPVTYDYVIAGGAFSPNDSVADLLHDGHLSPQAGISVVGTGSITDHVDLDPFLTGQVTTFGMLAILNISGLAEGTRIVVVDAFNGTEELRVVESNTGQFDAFLMLPLNTPRTGPLNLEIRIYYNNVHGSFVDQSGVFKIGEIWIGETVSYCAGLSLNYSYLNNAKIRYAAGGQQWPLLKPVTRALSFDLVPMDRTAALDSQDTDTTIDVHTLVKKLAASDTLFFAPFSSIPFNERKGLNIGTAQTLANTAFMGQLSSSPTIKSMQKLFAVHMDAQESL